MIHRCPAETRTKISWPLRSRVELSRYCRAQAALHGHRACSTNDDLAERGKSRNRERLGRFDGVDRRPDTPLGSGFDSRALQPERIKNRCEVAEGVVLSAAYQAVDTSKRARRCSNAAPRFFQAACGVLPRKRINGTPERRSQSDGGKYDWTMRQGKKRDRLDADPSNRRSRLAVER